MGEKYMPEFDTFEDCLQEMIKRYENNEDVRKPLKNFDNSLVITCKEENHPFMIKIMKDQGIEIKDNYGDNSIPLQVEFASKQVLLDLYNKVYNPLKAYSSGKIKIIKGSNRLLVKLRKLIF
jgi:hypothetical protein